MCELSVRVDSGYLLHKYIFPSTGYVETQRYISNNQQEQGRPHKAQHIHYHIPIKYQSGYYYPFWYYYHAYQKYKQQQQQQQVDETQSEDGEKTMEYYPPYHYPVRYFFQLKFERS